MQTRIRIIYFLALILSCFTRCNDIERHLENEFSFSNYSYTDTIVNSLGDTIINSDILIKKGTGPKLIIFNTSSKSRVYYWVFQNKVNGYSQGIDKLHSNFPYYISFMTQIHKKNVALYGIRVNNNKLEKIHHTPIIKLHSYNGSAIFKLATFYFDSLEVSYGFDRKKILKPSLVDTTTPFSEIYTIDFKDIRAVSDTLLVLQTLAYKSNETITFIDSFYFDSSDSIVHRDYYIDNPIRRSL